MKEFKEFLNERIISIESELKQIDIIYESLCNKLSNVDKLINDINHEIEFDNVSGAVMLKKYKELKTAFKIRRVCKNKLAYLTSLKSSLCTSHIEACKKSISKTEKIQSNLNYKKRISEQDRVDILCE